MSLSSLWWKSLTTNKFYIGIKSVTKDRLDIKKKKNDTLAGKKTKELKMEN